MVAPKKLSDDQAFQIYYSQFEAPEKKSTYELAKEFPNVNQSTIQRTAERLNKQFQADATTFTAYQDWKKQIVEAPYLFKIEARPDGSSAFTSPYPWVTDYMEGRYGRSRNPAQTVGNIRATMNRAQAIWLKLGKRNPNSWTRQDLNNILMQTTPGSKFSTSLAMRAVSPPLMSVHGMTTGLKGEPRKVAILMLPDFPQMFKQIVAIAKEKADDERTRDEIELILLTKAQTGIRTGVRRWESEIWGTRIAAGRSPIQFIGNDFTWHVYAKRGEEWDIGFKTDQLRTMLAGFVRKYDLKTGDWLLSIGDTKANRLLREACQQLNLTPLHLHDCRKIYVSFLVRAHIPLETAIGLNVGWKDMNTAFKHYLQFKPLWEEMEAQKRKFGGLFA